MIHIKHRIQILGLILILAIVFGCVSTTNVDAPDQVDTNSSFQAVVTVEVDSAGKRSGRFGVLVPNGWDADNVTYTGPYNGDMQFDEIWSEDLEMVCPSAPWDHWIGFITSEYHECNIGDVFEITVSVYTDDIIGTVEIAFLGTADSYFYGTPCSTTVEVVELNLEQSTWGAVKSEFRL